MLCVKCKKRMAVVFVARMENGTTKNEGYCLKCAKELGLAPVDDMLSKMGISAEEFDSISSEMMEMMGEEGDFSEGGAQSMSLLGKMMGKDEAEVNEKPKDGKKPKNKKVRLQSCPFDYSLLTGYVNKAKAILLCYSIT